MHQYKTKADHIQYGRFFMQNILIWKLILTSFFDFEVYCVMDQIAVTPILLMGAYINFFPIPTVSIVVLIIFYTFLDHIIKSS